MKAARGAAMLSAIGHLLAIPSAALFLCCASTELYAQNELSSEEHKQLADIDLTQAFHTPTTWRYVVTENSSSTGFNDDISDKACFVDGGKRDCEDLLAYTLGRTYIILPKGKLRVPLFVVTYDGTAGNGNYAGTTVYTYRAAANRFEAIFGASSPPNNSGEIRVIQDGPLVGDVIVSIPPRGRPYKFTIEVYRLQKALHYVKILSYQGKTGENDGNPLAAINSEMPEIERRLGLWKKGDPFPTPARMPEGNACQSVYMHNGIEDCRLSDAECKRLKQFPDSFAENKRSGRCK